MRFRYIGSNENMTAFGYDFRDGFTPEVTDDNAIKRLSGNRYFEALSEPSEPSEPEEPEEPEEVEEVAPLVADVIAEAQTGIVEGATLPEIIAEVPKKKPGRKPKAAQEP
jgi:hypothetical protein